MKIEVKKSDGTRRELKFEIPKDRVSQTLEEVYRDIGKAAKIKGYRPGKAPRHILEQHHNKLAHEELFKKLIPEVYQEGLEKEKLTPIDYPEIHDVSLKDGILTFTAKLDLRPEVSVKNYKGIKVTRKSSEVTEEEINKTLEYFKKGQGEGKEVQLDDAFARGLGFPGMDEFKKSLSRQMAMDKDRQNRVDIENQIIDELLKQTKFSVPASLIKKQVEHRMEEVKHRLSHQGMPPEEINKRDEEIRKDLEPAVERDIKAYLIFEKIAQVEGITAGEKENLPSKVIEFLLKEAKWEEK
ncbi:MAG: hypothetical protein A2Z88_06720 [Omnitrophica WOR_2 bacterium GWA2_47_8]|nr:MAG: hypothetical protein A2Z88_06720 [Omnitrophica WOR_2 bacterium GWA2_47_8]